MPRYEDDDEDDEDDDDYGDDGGDDAETVACAHCGADVYEDAEQCPRCGKYLSAEDAPPTRQRGWVTIVMVLALAAAVMWVFG
ncbi:MAG TPA: zinc-ribbon domain-containing protein [Urbifossiella sp.]|nr:zinc-ribbon domain-containing protein [Urbifossiella sp.]